jgi:hypothetical protein
MTRPSRQPSDALNRVLPPRPITVEEGGIRARRWLAHELVGASPRGTSRPCDTCGPGSDATTRRWTEPSVSTGRPRLLQRVFAPEFFMQATVAHHFPHGGAGYQTSQVAEKMRREVDETGAGGQDTGYGYKTKPLYHKSSGRPEATSVSAIFTVHPTYIVAMGEHKTDTSYQLYWRNPDVALWNVNNTIGLNNGSRIDVTNKATIRGVLNQKGYTTAFQRNGGQLGWNGSSAQGNQFTVDQTVRCGVDNVTLYALRGQGLKGVWERTADSRDTTLANSFRSP